MTQSTHIASGQTELPGTPVVVASGGRATFSLHVLPGVRIPDNITIPIYLDQGADKTLAGALSAAYRTWATDATGDFFAERPDITAYGVDIEVLVDA